MSLIHMKETITRALALTALVAVSALASAPQQTGVSATAAPRARRPMCMGCSDSARAKHEMLLTKLDSLRWEFGNRRLTESEELVFRREMSATLLALQTFLEANGAEMRSPTPLTRSGTVVGGFGGGASASASAGASGQGGSYTITVQTSKTGYLGVTFDGPSYGFPPPPERPNVIRFIQYPKIASVDPASPAERAGLLVGDTLLAMGGIDVVENSITLSKLLIPDEKVTLKVRRDGDPKEFRVVVGEAPAYVARRVSPVPGFTYVVPPEPGAPERVEIRERGGQGGARRAPDVVVAPMPPQPQLFFYFNAIGGARVETLTEGLGKAFGVKEGVLVIQVSPGTPAFISGLRDGDVILSAAGSAVATTRDLTRIISNSDDRENGIKLVVLREKKQHDVMLRWKQ